MAGNIDREFDYDDNDFVKIRAIIYKKAGINLSDSKRQLVYSRLARRLRALGLSSFKEYIEFLANDDSEQQEFVNALTTNLTAFFREAHHFKTLSQFVDQQKASRQKMRVWCAASSTGEEPYSIAMTLVEAYGTYTPPVEIIASDIDSNVLDFAKNGVYGLDRLESLSIDQKKKFFMRGKGSNEGKARVVNELRRLIDFRRINLLDSSWGMTGTFDVIFCRNVMIYFDKTTQLKLLERMVKMLHADGLYIAGHSESFSNASHLVKLVGKTTYKLSDSLLRSGNE